MMETKKIRSFLLWRILNCLVVTLILVENKTAAFTAYYQNVGMKQYQHDMVMVLWETSEGEVELVSGSVRKLVKEKVKRLAKSVWGNGAAMFSSPSIELLEKEASCQEEAALCLDEISLQKTNVGDALRNAESAIIQAEAALMQARAALQMATTEANSALQLAETAARQASETAERATELAMSSAQRSDDVVFTNVEELTYEDVDYHLCEMAPPFLDDSQCLVPGEPVVRVEKAPENSRRIFAGIDIPVPVDRIWEILTDYEHLQKVVPNLVVNEVLEYYNQDKSDDDNNEGEEEIVENGSNVDITEQCRELASQMKGSKLRQVGGAKVVGINFSARTTLEVREWPNGLPDFAHFQDEMYDGLSRGERYKLYQSQKLERYKFPRPFALSQLPTKDISMQSVEDDDGEFRMYQGVWRMQPLPGCTPQTGGESMRLSYAVEISPRPYLPVALVEGRISQDLCNNLMAIRKYVTDE